MKTSNKSNYNSLLLAAIAAIAVSLATTGCATMEGFGEDLEHVGKEIQEEADK